MINSQAAKFMLKISKIEGFDEADIFSINAQNRSGENALHYAVIWGDLHAAKALIESGININKQGEDLYTPLHEAIEKNDSQMVRLLLDSGANINILNLLGDSPLEMAVNYGLNDIISIFKNRKK